MKYFDISFKDGRYQTLSPFITVGASSRKSLDDWLRANALGNLEFKIEEFELEEGVTLDLTNGLDVLIKGRKFQFADEQGLCVPRMQRMAEPRPIEVSVTKKKAEVGLSKVEKGSVHLAVADPPWGIEWPGYGDFKDDRKGPEFVNWCGGWMRQCYDALWEYGSFWVAIGPEYVSELDVMAKAMGFHKRGQITQYATFGVANTKNFARSTNFWLYYTKHKKYFTFRAKDPLVRVPSARQLLYNDSRANPDGKLPDNAWVLHPDRLKECFTGHEDMWLASRVCGTFKERVFRGKYQDHKTCPQMPLEVMNRIILACSWPGDLVLDPFVGTGSTGASAVSLDRDFIGFDIDADRVKISRERIKKVAHEHSKRTSPTQAL